MPSKEVGDATLGGGGGGGGGREAVGTSPAAGAGLVARLLLAFGVAVEPMRNLMVLRMVPPSDISAPDPASFSEPEPAAE